MSFQKVSFEKGANISSECLNNLQLNFDRLIDNHAHDGTEAPYIDAAEVKLNGQDASNPLNETLWDHARDYSIHGYSNPDVVSGPYSDKLDEGDYVAIDLISDCSEWTFNGTYWETVVRLTVPITDPYSVKVQPVYDGTYADFFSKLNDGANFANLDGVIPLNNTLLNIHLIPTNLSSTEFTLRLYAIGKGTRHQLVAYNEYHYGNRNKIYIDKEITLPITGNLSKDVLKIPYAGGFNYIPKKGKLKIPVDIMLNVNAIVTPNSTKILVGDSVKPIPFNFTSGKNIAFVANTALPSTPLREYGYLGSQDIAGLSEFRESNYTVAQRDNILITEDDIEYIIRKFEIINNFNKVVNISLEEAINSGDLYYIKITEEIYSVSGSTNPPPTVILRKLDEVNIIAQHIIQYSKGEGTLFPRAVDRYGNITKTNIFLQGDYEVLDDEHLLLRNITYNGRKPEELWYSPPAGIEVSIPPHDFADVHSDSPSRIMYDSHKIFTDYLPSIVPNAQAAIYYQGIKSPEIKQLFSDMKFDLQATETYNKIVYFSSGEYVVDTKIKPVRVRPKQFIINAKALVETEYNAFLTRPHTIILRKEDLLVEMNGTEKSFVYEDGVAISLNKTLVFKALNLDSFAEKLTKKHFYTYIKIPTKDGWFIDGYAEIFNNNLLNYITDKDAENLNQKIVQRGEESTTFAGQLKSSLTIDGTLKSELVEVTNTDLTVSLKRKYYIQTFSKPSDAIIPERTQVRLTLSDIESLNILDPMFYDFDYSSYYEAWSIDPLYTLNPPMATVKEVVNNQDGSYNIVLDSPYHSSVGTLSVQSIADLDIYPSDVVNIDGEPVFLYKRLTKPEVIRRFYSNVAATSVVVANKYELVSNNEFRNNTFSFDLYAEEDAITGGAANNLWHYLYLGSELPFNKIDFIMEQALNASLLDGSISYQFLDSDESWVDLTIESSTSHENTNYVGTSNLTDIYKSRVIFTRPNISSINERATSTLYSGSKWQKANIPEIPSESKYWVRIKVPVVDYTTDLDTRKSMYPVFRSIAVSTISPVDIAVSSDVDTSISWSGDVGTITIDDSPTFEIEWDKVRIGDLITWENSTRKCSSIIRTITVSTNVVITVESPQFSGTDEDIFDVRIRRNPFGYIRNVLFSKDYHVNVLRQTNYANPIPPFDNSGLHNSLAYATRKQQFLLESSDIEPNYPDEFDNIRNCYDYYKLVTDYDELDINKFSLKGTFLFTDILPVIKSIGVNGIVSDHIIGVRDKLWLNLLKYNSSSITYFIAKLESGDQYYLVMRCPVALPTEENIAEDHTTGFGIGYFANKYAYLWENNYPVLTTDSDIVRDINDITVYENEDIEFSQRVAAYHNGTSNSFGGRKAIGLIFDTDDIYESYNPLRPTFTGASGIESVIAGTPTNELVLPISVISFGDNMLSNSGTTTTGDAFSFSDAKQVLTKEASMDTFPELPYEPNYLSLLGDTPFDNIYTIEQPDTTLDIVLGSRTATTDQFYNAYKVLDDYYTNITSVYENDNDGINRIKTRFVDKRTDGVGIGDLKQTNTDFKYETLVQSHKVYDFGRAWAKKKDGSLRLPVKFNPTTNENILNNIENFAWAKDNTDSSLNEVVGVDKLGDGVYCFVTPLRNIKHYNSSLDGSFFGLDATLSSSYQDLRPHMVYEDSDDPDTTIPYDTLVTDIITSLDGIEPIPAFKYLVDNEVDYTASNSLKGKEKCILTAGVSNEIWTSSYPSDGDVVQTGSGNKYIFIDDKWREVATSSINEFISKFDPDNPQESLIWHIVKVDDEYMLYIGNYTLPSVDSVLLNVQGIISITPETTFGKLYLDSAGKIQYKNANDALTTWAINPSKVVVSGSSILPTPTKAGYYLSLGKEDTTEYEYWLANSNSTNDDEWREGGYKGHAFWYDGANWDFDNLINFIGDNGDSAIVKASDDNCYYLRDGDSWTVHKLNIFEDETNGYLKDGTTVYVAESDSIYVLSSTRNSDGSIASKSWNQIESNNGLRDKFVAIGDSVTYTNPLLNIDTDDEIKNMFLGNDIFIRTQELRNNFRQVFNKIGWDIPDYDEYIYETFLGKVKEVLLKKRDQTVYQSSTNPITLGGGFTGTVSSGSVAVEIGETVVSPISNNETVDIYLRFVDQPSMLNKDLIDLAFKTPLPQLEDSEYDKDLIGWTRTNANSIKENTYPKTRTQIYNIDDYCSRYTLNKTTFFPLRSHRYKEDYFFDTKGMFVADTDTKPMIACEASRKRTDIVDGRPSKLSHHLFKKLVIRKPVDDLFSLLDYIEDPNRDYMTGQERAPLVDGNGMDFNREIPDSISKDSLLELKDKYGLEYKSSNYSRLAYLGNSGSANLLTVVSKTSSSEGISLKTLANYIEADNLDTYISAAFVKSFGINKKIMTLEGTADTDMPSYAISLNGNYEVMAADDTTEPKVSVESFKTWSELVDMIDGTSTKPTAGKRYIITDSNEICLEDGFYDVLSPNLGVCATDQQVDVQDYLAVAYTRPYDDNMKWKLYEPSFGDTVYISGTYYEYGLSGWASTTTPNRIQRTFTLYDRNLVLANDVSKLYPGMAVLSSSVRNYEDIYKDTTGELVKGYIKRIKYKGTVSDGLDYIKFTMNQVGNTGSNAYPPKTFGPGSAFVVKDRVQRDDIMNVVELFYGSTPGDILPHYTEKLKETLGLEPIYETVFVDTTTPGYYYFNSPGQWTPTGDFYTPGEGYWEVSPGSPIWYEGSSVPTITQIIGYESPTITDDDYAYLLPEGTKFIVPSVALGEWVGHEDQIATWSGSEWTYEIPKVGRVMAVIGRNQYVKWNGTEWVDIIAPKYWWAATVPEETIAIAKDVISPDQKGTYLSRFADRIGIWKYMTPSIGDIIINDKFKKLEYRTGSPIMWHSMDDALYEIELDNGEILDSGTYKTGWVYPPMLTKIPEDYTRHSFYTADVDNRMLFTNNLIFDYENRIMITSYNDRYFGRQNLGIHKNVYEDIQGQFYNRAEDIINITSQDLDLKNPIKVRTLDVEVIACADTLRDGSNTYYKLYANHDGNFIEITKAQASKFETISDGKNYFLCIDDSQMDFVYLDIVKGYAVSGLPNYINVPVPSNATTGWDYPGGRFSQYAYTMTFPSVMQFRLKPGENFRIENPENTIFDFPFQKQKWVGNIGNHNFWLRSKGTKGYSFFKDLNDVHKYDGLHGKDVAMSKLSAMTTKDQNKYWPWNIFVGATAENNADFDSNHTIFDKFYAPYCELYAPVAIPIKDGLVLPHYKYNKTGSSVVNLAVNNKQLEITAEQTPHTDLDKYGTNNSMDTSLQTIQNYRVISKVIEVAETEMGSWDSGAYGFGLPVEGVDEKQPLLTDHLPADAVVGDKVLVKVVSRYQPQVQTDVLAVVASQAEAEAYFEDDSFRQKLDGSYFIVKNAVVGDPFYTFDESLIQWKFEGAWWKEINLDEYSQALVSTTEYYYWDTGSGIIWTTTKPPAQSIIDIRFYSFDRVPVLANAAKPSYEARWIQGQLVPPGQNYGWFLQQSGTIEKVWKANKTEITGRDDNDNLLELPYTLDNLLVQGVNANHRLKTTSNKTGDQLEGSIVYAYLSKEAVRDMNLQQTRGNETLVGEQPDVINIFEVLDEGLRNSKTYTDILTSTNLIIDSDTNWAEYNAAVRNNYKTIFSPIKNIINEMLAMNPIAIFSPSLSAVNYTVPQGETTTSKFIPSNGTNYDKVVDGIILVSEDKWPLTSSLDIAPSSDGTYLLLRAAKPIEDTHIEIERLITEIDDIKNDDRSEIANPQTIAKRNFLMTYDAVSHPDEIVTYEWDWDTSQMTYTYTVPTDGVSIYIKEISGDYTQYMKWDSTASPVAAWIDITETEEGYSDACIDKYVTTTPGGYDGWEGLFTKVESGTVFKVLEDNKYVIYRTPLQSRITKLGDIDIYLDKNYNGNVSMLRMIADQPQYKLTYLYELQKQLGIDLSPFIHIVCVSEKSNREVEFNSNYFEYSYPPRSDGKTNELLTISTTPELLMEKAKESVEEMKAPLTMGYYVRFVYDPQETVTWENWDFASHVDKFQFGPPRLYGPDDDLTIDQSVDSEGNLENGWEINENLLNENNHWVISLQNYNAQNQSTVTYNTTQYFSVGSKDNWKGINNTQHLALKINQAAFDIQRFEKVEVERLVKERIANNTSTEDLQYEWVWLGNVTAIVMYSYQKAINATTVSQKNQISEKVVAFSAADYNKLTRKFDMTLDDDWLSAKSGKVYTDKAHSLLGAGPRIAYNKEWLTDQELIGTDYSTGLTTSAAHGGVDIDSFRTTVTQFTDDGSVNRYAGFVTSILRGNKGVFYGFQPNAGVVPGKGLYGWYYFVIPSLFDYVRLPMNHMSWDGKDVYMECLTNDGWLRTPVIEFNNKDTKDRIKIRVPSQFGYTKEVEYGEFLPLIPTTIQKQGPPYTNRVPREFGQIMSNSLFYQFPNIPLPSDARSWRDGGPTWSTNVLDWNVRPIGGYWFRVLTNISDQDDRVIEGTLNISDETLIRENDIFEQYNDTISKENSVQSGTISHPQSRKDILDLVYSTPPQFLNIVKNECWIEDASIDTTKDGKSITLLIAGKQNGKVKTEVHTVNVSS